MLGAIEASLKDGCWVASSTRREHGRVRAYEVLVRGKVMEGVTVVCRERPRAYPIYIQGAAPVVTIYAAPGERQCVEVSRRPRKSIAQW